MNESKHYCEDTIVGALQRHISRASICRVAVAFCGEDAYKFFPERPASWPPDLRIVVDASDAAVKRGLTNPKGIERLFGFTRNFRSLEGLHAKVFIFDDTSAIVGSVNLSRSSIEQQYQLAVEVSELRLVKELIEWFDSKIWEPADKVDSDRLNNLRSLWPNHDFHFPVSKKRGKLPEWHGAAPQPPLSPSDFSIGITKNELQGLLARFKVNKCEYSKSGQTCLQVSDDREQQDREHSKQFHELMQRRDTWTKEDLGAVFDLAFTHGRAAQMRKRLFVDNDPETVAKSLTFLLEGDGDSYTRFEKLLELKNNYKVPGLGEAGLAFLVHLWKPSDFPVLNASVEKAFKLLRIKFNRGKSRQTGQGYMDRTTVIREIMNRTGLETFTRTDCFLDAIGKGHLRVDIAT